MNDEIILVACDGSVVPKKKDEKKMYLGQLWHKETYPDDYVLCKIGFNLAKKCREIHLKGMILADEWNEGNVVIDPQNGLVSLANLYKESPYKGSVYRADVGMLQYLAPECYIDSMYDYYSDCYSMAVFLYRLFIGGFPLDGKASVEFLANSDLLIDEAAPVIYGSSALFAFDPNNQSNSIRNHVNELMPRLYEIQTQRWDAIDERIKKCFIQTFSDGLQADNKRKRTTDREWMQVFKVVAKTGLKQCPVCHRRLFIGRTVCPWCK